jgi:hypothetical protein
VWLTDFEFGSPTGGRPAPVCLVAKEYFTGRLVRLWLADGAPLVAPFDTGPGALFVAYYASAELGCFLALDWPAPARILDLCAEFKCRTSGLPVPGGKGLLGALAFFGLDSLSVAEKKEMQALALRGGPYTGAEQQALLDYCQTDVDALARLLPAMLPAIDRPRALLRGRYMAAAARMEWAGVPIDTEALGRLRENWTRIKARLIAEVNQDYGVFEPVERPLLNPESRFGAAVLAEAAARRLDPRQLATAVDWLWREERRAGAEAAAALDRARQTTGLTPGRIEAWERSGKDYSLFPGLDVTAQDLAGRYPALGLGPGYDPDAPDQGDPAGLLWDKLRNPVKPRLKYDPRLLCEAADRLEAVPEGQREYVGEWRFSARLFEAWLSGQGIPWPRLEGGALALDDDTFREMARTHPAQVGPLRELRHALSQLRLHELAVGPDGRNRLLLSAFSSSTGRNQPSNSRYIFGPSTWLRFLIRPGPGRALAYIDWSAQELGIAAALSGDQAMREAYQSGDPYIWLARRVGAVPADATKKSHSAQREQFKVVSLGVLYGMTEVGLARRLDVPTCRGRELLRYHRETFRRFWAWSDTVLDEGLLTGRLRTVFGWECHTGPNLNPRSLRNFPMQANGAEMLRLACCLATERGVEVCAPVHDALLVEGPAREIEDVAAATRQAMVEASELVLPGFPLRTDAKTVVWPNRYTDERGQRMWDVVCSLIDDMAGWDPCPPG